MGDRGSSTSREQQWVIEMKEKVSRMEPLMTKEKEEEQSERNRRARLYDFYHSDIGSNLNLVKPIRVSLSGISSYFFKDYEMKEASLLHFLRRSGKPLESYLAALRDVVDQLTDAYYGLGYWRHRGDDHDFVPTILNGAFLLEFIRTKSEYSRRSLLQHSPDASVNLVMWRILEDHDETKCYQHDILLMGNQTPIMVLERLLMVDQGTTRIHKDYWINFLKDIATTFIPVNRVPQIEHVYIQFKSSLHILDVYRRCLVHRDAKNVKTKQRTRSHEELYSMHTPSATELNKVGMGFTISGSISMMSVSLRGKILRLPEIVIDDSTFYSFVNLITFEQFHKDVAKNEVASYIYFMGCLVLVDSDASLLQSCGIIITTWPPDRVADLFNRMTKKCCSIPSDFLAPEIIETFTMVRERYNKMSIEWRKDLFQTYLKSPWAILSVVAAILLFTLSIIQTVYTVLGYVRPK